MDAALQILTAVACMVICARAEGSCNHMTDKTDHGIRYAFLFLVGVSGAMVVAICLGYVPGWREAALSVGFAAVMLCDRRLRRLSSAADRKAIP